MKTNKNNTKYIGRDLEAMAVATNYYKWLMNEFGQYIGEYVAEIGAGGGTFSKYILQDEKIKKFYGVEPSDEMYVYLEKEIAKHNNAVAINDFFGYPSFIDLPDKLDTIFYINVLEHVEKDEEELKHAYESLNKGGYICIYVPALNWLMGTFDQQVGHYRRYHKNSMKELLEGVGFDVLRVNYSDMIGVLPWYVTFKIIKKTDLQPSEVNLYDKVVIPILEKTERVVKPPFGKNLFLVAQKK